MCLSNTCLHVTGATLGWAGLGWARGVTKMFSQFLLRLRVTPAPAAVNSCGSIMEKKNGDVWRNGRLAGMNM